MAAVPSLAMAVISWLGSLEPGMFHVSRQIKRHNNTTEIAGYYLWLFTEERLFYRNAFIKVLSEIASQKNFDSLPLKIQ